jgi:hypothetical protein
VTEANRTAERTTALDMIEDNAGPGSTVGGDKAYDTAAFVAGCRARGCTPHVSQNDTNRRSTIDGRTTRHPGYRISTIKRKQIEEPFGWIKTVGVCARRGIAAAAWWSGSSCSPLPHTTSSASQNFWRRQDEAAWSADNEARYPPMACMRRRIQSIDRVIAARIMKIDLKSRFFSSLLAETF